MISVVGTWTLRSNGRPGLHVGASGEVVYPVSSVGLRGEGSGLRI